MDINSSKKVNLDINGPLTLYRYKNYLLPLVVILVCVLLMFFIIIPQIKQYFASQEELKTEKQKLNVLKNNYNFLSNLDEAKSDADLSTLSLALPPNKDFVGMLGAISQVAAKTNVQVGNFEFSLGNLSSVSSQGLTAYPSIKININLSGDAESINKLAAELYKTVPVAEVTSIKYTGNTAILVILFYYKPFTPQNVDDQTPVVPFSASDLALIKDIYSWNNAAGQPFIPFLGSSVSSSSSTLSSTPSSETNPSPF